MCQCGTHHTHSHHHVAPDCGHDHANRAAFDRRVVMKAAAGMAAIAATGGIATTAGTSPVAAQSAGGTRASRWEAGATLDAKASGENGVSDGFRTFQTDFPFYALGASWAETVGVWPVVEVQLSADGESWSDSTWLSADVEDGGQPTRDNRVFTPLVFVDGASWVRFRTTDADGNLGSVAELSFTYIDATDGPWEQDVAGIGTTLGAANDDTAVPPQLLTRAQWGADESYRLDSDGNEIWPTSYELVHHIVVHHTDTPTYQDPLVAIRSIYYYHAVDQGWGDIGYNYLVDRNGTIYEGRYGGQNAVGGHSYQYAWGSSGITIIGDYQEQIESDEARAGLVSILSWVGRDLDPLGTRDFLDIPDLPVICAHRDVNSTACPGDMLYYDLPYIRNLVAETIAAGALETANPGGVAVGDRVVVQTDDGGPLNARESGSMEATILKELDPGTTAWVIDGPVVGDTENWYQIDWSDGTGWVTARYLVVVPPDEVEGAEPFTIGENIVFRASANLRADVGTAAEVLAEVPEDEYAAVLAGPEISDDYEWYQIRTVNYGTGWVARTFVVTAPIDYAPGGDFAAGDAVVTSDSVSVRVGPGLAQTIVTDLGKGTYLTVTDTAIWVTDHFWWPVLGDFGSGWVAQDFLKDA